MSKRVESVFLNWSSGKDASMALYKMLKDDDLIVDRLLTTVSGSNDRISMHGLHISLLKAQAKAIGQKLDIVYLPENLDMEQYRLLITEKMKEYQDEDINTSVFGDIFLEDLRNYRENQLNSIGMKALFPLWKIPTDQLMQDFIEQGFKAIVVSINNQVLDRSFCGRELDQKFLDDLPKNVDPCGENGEFHTFCYDGPIFKYPVTFEIGEQVYKTYPAPKGNKDGLKEYGFWFNDLITKF